MDKLYELSFELASAFDWPLASSGNLTGTRPRSETAAWFVLTGEAPPVRPIEARWEAKYGSTHLNPQWRIKLTIPSWLPEEEALLFFRLLRRERPKGLKLPKEAKTLEVARFVWEQERLDGYRKRPPWKVWWKRWNEVHPGYRFRTLTASAWPSSVETLPCMALTSAGPSPRMLPASAWEPRPLDTTLTPPGTQYGATGGKPEKRKRLRYGEFANLRNPLQHAAAEKKEPKVDPDLKLGICVEHGDDPGSIKFLTRLTSTTFRSRPTGCRSHDWPLRGHP